MENSYRNNWRQVFSYEIQYPFKLGNVVSKCLSDFNKKVVIALVKRNLIATKLNALAYLT